MNAHSMMPGTFGKFNPLTGKSAEAGKRVNRKVKSDKIFNNNGRYFRGIRAEKMLQFYSQRSYWDEGKTT